MRKGITSKDDDQALDAAYIISKFFVTVMFVFETISLVKDISMPYGFRRGIFPFKFLYPHATFLANSLVLASVVPVAYDKASFMSKLLFYMETVITLFIITQQHERAISRDGREN